MIALAANKSIMRSKFPNNAFLEFQSYDLFVSRKCDHEIETQKSYLVKNAAINEVCNC
jgi:hypothetical protein